MASDMFLKIKGIKGEAKDAGHKDEIDIITWSWGTFQSGSSHMGGGGGSGKVRVSDLTFVKPVDCSTPDLALACASGKHFEEAVLVTRKAGENPLEYHKFVMSELLVSSFQLHSSDDLTLETVSLNFARYRYEYSEQDAKGKGLSPCKMGWDVPANKKI